MRGQKRQTWLQQVYGLLFREVMWQNTNKHLYKIRECIGVKTGITPGAGPCLSSAYKIGSR